MLRQEILGQEKILGYDEKKFTEAANKWYFTDVINEVSYIDAAFRSSNANEAYIFMQNEYILLNYDPAGGKILHGPIPIGHGFPSLISTPLGEYGIDCAFDTNKNKAFIFSTNIQRSYDNIFHVSLFQRYSV